MFKYVESLGVHVVANDRNAIRPKELDIYLPDFQVGIEYDGLYWHKEASLVSKTNKCDKNGIRLIRFYESRQNVFSYFSCVSRADGRAKIGCPTMPIRQGNHFYFAVGKVRFIEGIAVLTFNPRDIMAIPFYRASIY